ncbi:MAG: hypothetical protein N2316_06210 [Spirochaetes bacterium]|nr:hypothetical protein [Spirochaetota bacterium]
MKFRKSKSALALILTCFSAVVYGSSHNLSNRVQNDETLVIPGIGAEKVLIDDNKENVIARLGSPIRVVTFENAQEVFTTIFQLPPELHIPFEDIYYYGNEHGIIFFHKGNVSAIGGFAKKRVTHDGVSLENGIQRVIFHYGNEELLTLAKGKHRAYIYFQKGIALFDDNGDDGIDLYLIFKPHPARNK